MDIVLIRALRVFRGPKGDRLHHYENKEWFANTKLEYDQPPPLVIMRRDGSLLIRENWE